MGMSNPGRLHRHSYFREGVLAQFPLISANIQLKETGELCFAPNKLFDLMDGTKVGVFGLTTPETLKTARPDNVEEFSILTDDELFACAQEQVDELRKRGADIVVCLAHLGNEEMLVPNTSREVLFHVKGIDLFIDGHDHLLVEDQVEGTLLVETGCHFANIGLVIIDSGVPANESIAYGDYDGIDTATQSIIDEVHVRVDEELNVVLASTPFKLNADRSQARREEANLGDLHADAMVYDAEQATGQHVDGALLNAAALRASIDAGDITLEKVKRVLPYSNQVCVLKVSGAELLEVIEVGCAVVGTGEEMKSFPQVSGIEFSVNATVPFEKGEPYPDSIYCAPAAPGSRVTIHTVGGADFDEDATYAIAVTDFMAQGGDTFYPFKLAAEKEEPVTCDFDYEALVGYLIGPLDHEVDERYREPQGRITIIEG